MKQFFKTLIPNIYRSFFAGKNFLYHMLAIALTFTIVESGFDWVYFLSVRGERLNAIFFPAIVIGGILPIILPLCLIPFKKTSVYGWALAQAALLGSFISSFYKSLTGRVQPNLTDLMHDSSHSFHFGFWEHGVFWGWPSSHTTIAFAMAVTLIYLFPKNKMVRILALVYAFYIGIGVSFSIHWFSEFIAGAIIGSCIGYVVGTSFYGQKILAKKKAGVK